MNETSTTRSHEAACILIALLGIDTTMHNANIITIKNFFKGLIITTADAALVVGGG